MWPYTCFKVRLIQCCTKCYSAYILAILEGINVLMKLVYFVSGQTVLIVWYGSLYRDAANPFLWSARRSSG